jgi:hypothetical protein
MGGSPGGIGRGAYAAFSIERGVGDQVTVAFPLEASGAEHLAGRGHIGCDDFELRRDAVPLGIARGKRRQSRVDFDRCYSNARNARQQTESGDAHAGADIEHPLASLSRDRGGEKDRIAP